ncbi:MAG: acyl carrier protein [Anaerovoracaceae bacterium]
MEIKNFIQNFANQFEEIDVAEFKEETKFRELNEWNSLVALSVIAMVDEEYDVTLKGNDIASAVTVGDLYNVVRNKL